MIPVRTDTLDGSTALKISIFSEKSFCMLDIKLLSVMLQNQDVDCLWTEWEKLLIQGLYAGIKYLRPWFEISMNLKAGW